jgi:NhaP-type Na+/H+ or K+/H+ antiporter
MLGLGLLGLHDLGANWWRWLAVDVVWSVAAGLAIGAALGTAIGRVVIHLRRRHREALGTDDFLAMGLIALTYGVTVLCHAYGFLAVFVAGLALRRMERRSSGEAAPELVKAAAREAAIPGGDETAAHPGKASAYMAEAVRSVTESLERIGELIIVLLVGALLSPATVSARAAGLAALLIFAIRPLAVVVGLAGHDLPRHERWLTAWFGIRGIGSIYYLMYALHHGVPEELRPQLIMLTLTTVAISTAIHGISVTPLMSRHARRPAA